VGVGKKPPKLRAARVASSGGDCAKRARASGPGRSRSRSAKEARGGLGAAELAQLVIEGAPRAGWQFTELRSSPRTPSRDRIDRAGGRSDGQGRSEALPQSATRIAAGYLFTRDLQMQPGNVATPSLPRRASQEARANTGSQVTILDRAQIKKEGWGALLAVAQGSAEEPRFIVLEYGGGSVPPLSWWARARRSTPAASRSACVEHGRHEFDKSVPPRWLGTFEVLGVSNRRST